MSGPVGLIDSRPNTAASGGTPLARHPAYRGAAVIAGHVDSDTGPDVFAALHLVTTGDRILVRLQDDTALRFEVTRVGRYPQRRFPTQQVCATTQRPQLRLITCGGDYDDTAGRYLGNLVVFAVLTRS